MLLKENAEYPVPEQVANGVRARTDAFINDSECSSRNMETAMTTHVSQSTLPTRSTHAGANKRYSSRLQHATHGKVHQQGRLPISPVIVPSAAFTRLEGLERSQQSV